MIDEANDWEARAKMKFRAGIREQSIIALTFWGLNLTNVLSPSNFDWSVQLIRLNDMQDSIVESDLLLINSIYIGYFQ